jgi:hypothetical protein
MEANAIKCYNEKNISVKSREWWGGQFAEEPTENEWLGWKEMNSGIVRRLWLPVLSDTSPTSVVEASRPLLCSQSLQVRKLYRAHFCVISFEKNGMAEWPGAGTGTIWKLLQSDVWRVWAGVAWRQAPWGQLSKGLRTHFTAELWFLTAGSWALRGGIPKASIRDHLGVAGYWWPHSRGPRRSHLPYCWSGHTDAVSWREECQKYCDFLIWSTVVRKGFALICL